MNIGKGSIMKRNDGLKLIIGIIFWAISILVTGYTGYIVFNGDTYFDLDGWIIFGTAFIVPLIMGTALIINSTKGKEMYIKIMRYCLFTILIFYLLSIIDILFFNRFREIEIVNMTVLKERLRLNANFVPFKTIGSYIIYFFDGSINKSIVIRNIMANFILFMPMGMLLPSLVMKLRNMRDFLVFMVAMLISIELLQFIIGVGSLDIDDVILNLAGAMIFWKIWNVGFIQVIMKRIHIITE